MDEISNKRILKRTRPLWVYCAVHGANAATETSLFTLHLCELFQVHFEDRSHLMTEGWQNEDICGNVNISTYV